MCVCVCFFFQTQSFSKHTNTQINKNTQNRHEFDRFAESVSGVGIYTITNGVLEWDFDFNDIDSWDQETIDMAITCFGVHPREISYL